MLFNFNSLKLKRKWPYVASGYGFDSTAAMKLDTKCVLFAAVFPAPVSRNRHLIFVEIMNETGGNLWQGFL